MSGDVPPSSAPSVDRASDRVLDLPGVMSRKKQVAPKLLGALANGG